VSVSSSLLRFICQLITLSGLLLFIKFIKDAYTLSSSSIMYDFLKACSIKINFIISVQFIIRKIWAKKGMLAIIINIMRDIK
jgi:hypothetical protein